MVLCDKLYSRVIPAGSLPLLGALLLSAGCSAPPPPPLVRPHDTPSPPPVAAITPATAPAIAPATTMEAMLKRAASERYSPPAGDGWEPLFDGSSLTGWRATQFTGGGRVECQSGLLVLNMGDPFTGINLTNECPKMNYEVALDAMRVSGSDFFCGLTVPVGESFCSLIVGGWGGTLLGISSLDGMDASENETMKYVNFENGRWYRIRLRVTETRLQAWIDNDKLVDVVTKGRKISLRPGDIELSKPFGLAAWQTTAALRQIQWRTLDP